MYKYGDLDETMSVPMKPQPNAEVQHNNSNTTALSQEYKWKHSHVIRFA